MQYARLITPPAGSITSHTAFVASSAVAPSAIAVFVIGVPKAYPKLNMALSTPEAMQISSAVANVRRGPGKSSGGGGGGGGGAVLAIVGTIAVLALGIGAVALRQRRRVPEP